MNTPQIVFLGLGFVAFAMATAWLCRFRRYLLRSGGFVPLKQGNTGLPPCGR